ncbi:MAG: acyl carrier protein [Clostridia bacterium]|jgi:acyl carrier protein|nr:acyl carrier protein [Clostridia bacterium]
MNIKEDVQALIKAKTDEIFVRAFGLADPSQLDYAVELSALGVNSIDFIKLVVAMETEFDFEFRDEDLNSNKFETLNSFVDYIQQMTQSV